MSVFDQPTKYHRCKSMDNWLELVWLVDVEWADCISVIGIFHRPQVTSCSNESHNYFLSTIHRKRNERQPTQNKIRIHFFFRWIFFSLYYICISFLLAYVSMVDIFSLNTLLFLIRIRDNSYRVSIILYPNRTDARFTKLSKRPKKKKLQEGKGFIFGFVVIFFSFFISFGRLVGYVGWFCLLFFLNREFSKWIL